MDIAVIGAGHAGIEAAVSGARAGIASAKTLMFLQRLSSGAGKQANSADGEKIRRYKQKV